MENHALAEHLDHINARLTAVREELHKLYHHFQDKRLIEGMLRDLAQVQEDMTIGRAREAFGKIAFSRNLSSMAESLHHDVHFEGAAEKIRLDAYYKLIAIQRACGALQNELIGHII